VRDLKAVPGFWAGQFAACTIAAPCDEGKRKQQKSLKKCEFS
jgi:hypothetical protein